MKNRKSILTYIVAAVAILVTTPPASSSLGVPPLQHPLILVAWWSGDGHPNDIQGTNNGTFPASDLCLWQSQPGFQPE